MPSSEELRHPPMTPPRMAGRSRSCEGRRWWHDPQALQHPRQTSFPLPHQHLWLSSTPISQQNRPGLCSGPSLACAAPHSKVTGMLAAHFTPLQPPFPTTVPHSSPLRSPPAAQQRRAGKNWAQLSCFLSLYNDLDAALVERLSLNLFLLLSASGKQCD